MNIKVEESNLAKFIFSITIIFYHICVWGYGINTSWLKLVCQISMFGFLFLSGYGLTTSFYQNGLCNYWNKKFEKIYAPAIVVNTVAVVILVLLRKVEYDRGKLFVEIFMLSQNPVVNTELWFLRLLLVWYILFFIVYNYVRKYKNRMIMMGAVTLLMCYIIPETYGLANLYSLSFSVGIFLAEIKKQNAVSKKSMGVLKTIIYIVAFFGTIVFINYVDYNGVIFNITINFYVFMLISNIVFGCSVIVIMEICKIIINRSDIIYRHSKTLGDMSLMIYFLQRPFVLDPMIWGNGTLIKSIYMIIGCTLILIISYIYIRIPKVSSIINKF